MAVERMRVLPGDRNIIRVRGRLLNQCVAHVLKGGRHQLGYCWLSFQNLEVTDGVSTVINLKTLDSPDYPVNIHIHRFALYLFLGFLLNSSSLSLSFLFPTSFFLLRLSSLS